MYCIELISINVVANIVINEIWTRKYLMRDLNNI